MDTMCIYHYSIPAAQAVGILGSALLSGTILSLSLFTIPILILPARKPPSAPCDIHFTPGAPIGHLTHQWLYLYNNRSRRVFPLLAGAASAAHGYLAWCFRYSARKQACWCLLAGVVTLGMCLFDGMAMHGVNGRLKARATRDDASLAEGKEGMVMSEQEMAKRGREDQEVLGLLCRWSWLNGMKALFPLVGAVVGLYATV